MNENAFRTTIGIEVHLQLKTNTKAFCGCPNSYGKPPNTMTCPVCLGHPGTIPVPNRESVKLALITALALNCKINQNSYYERKNYFYPDLPKGFQISQYELPLGYNGYLEFYSGREGEGVLKWDIERVHLEEDTAKLFHADGETLLDFNRAGIPLMEVVTKPMDGEPEDAYYYLRALRSTLFSLGISDCNMEEGSLRCDTNISVSPVDSDKYGTKVEVKNLNSFRSVRMALHYERERQLSIIDDGGEVVQETRLWDEGKQETRSMRGKEETADYRYFPEPDIPPIEITNEWIDKLKGELPSLYKDRIEEIMGFSIGYQEAVIVADRPEMYFYFRNSLKHNPDGKALLNFILGDLSAMVGEKEMDFSEIPVKPSQLASLVDFMSKGDISSKIARDVLKKVWDTGKDPSEIIEEDSLKTISTDDELEPVLKQVIEENPQPVKSYLEGKEQAVVALIGAVMKETGGKADPQLVKKLLLEMLESMR
jgi:aspartyl-tRNA(Asn)/glutamyl-tRNA(Gln) amidotransferase subunit B